MLALVSPQTTIHRPVRPPPRKPSASSSSSASSNITRSAVAPPPVSRRATPSRAPEPQPPAPPPAPAPEAPPPVAARPAPFDIHAYPSPDLLRLLAALLAQIAATNDKLDSVAPPTPPSTTPTRTTLATVTPTDAPIWRTLTTASRTAVSTPSSVLTFHARNVPTISLEAYLLRILKYCPTTNEVFLSLLVYFDRMSKLSSEATGRTFVIDSYNIHRLVIAGVTVASKFFSDVFYTNSRYAKVGGLPQAELNQLELQFLLLNDFRLVIPRDEMQRYAEQLILFSNSPPDATIPSAPVAAPMQAMGAIDAYGGRVMPSSTQKVPQPNGVAAAYPSSSSHASSASASTSSSASAASNKTPSFRPRADTGDDTETETETDGGTETETETEGGWTTDDEPTIRPAHSSAGSSSDDTRSLSSADDTEDEEEEEDGRMEGVVEAVTEEGDRTPERAMGDRTPERRRTRDGVRTPAARDLMATSP